MCGRTLRDHNRLNVSCFGKSIHRTKRRTAVGGVALLAACLLIGGFGAGVAQAHGGPKGQVGISACAPPQDESQWINDYMELLRQLFQALGGDPARMDPSPSVAMSQINRQFDQYGLTQLSHDGLNSGLEAITNLKAYLAAAPADFDTSGYEGLDVIQEALLGSD